MKLNLVFVPFDGSDKEFKIVAYGDKDALVSVLKGVQVLNFCTNVYLSEEKKDNQ